MVVFALDIVMDIKFRKLYDTELSGFKFSGSFPWVHFNVFSVKTLLRDVNSDFEGSDRIPIHDSVEYFRVLEESATWLSTW